MCLEAEELYIDLFSATVWMMRNSLSMKRGYISILQPQESRGGLSEKENGGVGSRRHK